MACNSALPQVRGLRQVDIDISSRPGLAWLGLAWGIDDNAIAKCKSIGKNTKINDYLRRLSIIYFSCSCLAFFTISECSPDSSVNYATTTFLNVPSVSKHRSRRSRNGSAINLTFSLSAFMTTRNLAANATTRARLLLQVPSRHQSKFVLKGFLFSEIESKRQG